MIAKLLELFRSKFLRDTATLQVAGMLNQASQVLSTVLIAALLGARGQGQFVSAIALQALIHFLINVGASQAAISQIAAACARENRVKVAGWLAFMVKTILVVGGLVFALGWMVLPWVGENLYGLLQPEIADDGRLIGYWAWLLCLQPLLELPRTVATVAFQGTRRMLALGQVENGQEIVRLFLVALGATITGSPFGAICGTLGASAIGSLVAVEVFRRELRVNPGLLPGVREVARGVKAVPLLRGLRQGLRIGLLKNGNTLFLTVFPRLIIGGVVGMDWVAYFHIAQRIMQVPMMFLLGVSRTVLPALGELAGLKDMSRFRQLFWRVTGFSGLLVGGGILALLPFVHVLVEELFPRGYAEPVSRYYLILCFGYVPFSLGAAIESFYITANQVRAWLLLTLLGAILTIPTNVWMILSIPYTGTAWGISLYQSWVLVHLGYIAFFFATHRQDETWEGAAATVSPEEASARARDEGELEDERT